MSNTDWLRERLECIVAATPDAEITAGFWVGDKAGERRVADNLASGRLFMSTARRRALSGIEALDRQDLDTAQLLMRDAEGLRAAAIEAQMTARQFEALTRDAGARGSGNKTDRDRRLADAVAVQESRGLKGKEARGAAIRSDAVLQAEFAMKGDAAIRAALRRVKLER